MPSWTKRNLVSTWKFHMAQVRIQIEKKLSHDLDLVNTKVNWTLSPLKRCSQMFFSNRPRSLLGVSENSGTFPPKSSILIGFFHYFHHPIWGKHPYFYGTFQSRYLDLYTFRHCLHPGSQWINPPVILTFSHLWWKTRYSPIKDGGSRSWKCSFFFEDGWKFQEFLCDF